jgi:Domain of unknown function (DUF4136)
MVKGVFMRRIFALGALLCAVLPISAHKIRVDFNPAAHFSSYKTYSWVYPAGIAGSSEALFPNELMRERITGFIDEALAARGFKRVTKAGDLLISYRVDVTEQPVYLTDYGAAGFGCGWDWDCGWSGWGGGWATTTVQTIYYGTLVVDMVDARANELVFQGTSTQEISSKPEKNTRKLAKAVSEVFERYPPQP